MNWKIMMMRTIPSHKRMVSQECTTDMMTKTRIAIHNQTQTTSQMMRIQILHMRMNPTITTTTSEIMMINPQGLKYQEWKSQEWITILKMSRIIQLKYQEWKSQEWITILKMSTIIQLKPQEWKSQ